MVIETMMLPVISTAHLTYAEANANALAFPAFTMIGEFGLIAYVANIDLNEHRNFPNLAKLGQWAKAHGWDWIRFDRDADKVDGLEVFEW